jgi:hypothetical protein
LNAPACIRTRKDLAIGRIQLIRNPGTMDFSLNATRIRFVIREILTHASFDHSFQSQLFHA